MPCDRAQARDEMGAVILAAARSIDDCELELVWDDNPDNTPAADATWARVTMVHNAGGDANLAGDRGQRRYDRSGVFTIQLFTPSGDGLTKADEYAKVFERAMQGKSTPNGVWFRNVSSNEVGVDGSWFQTNVTGDFAYTEII